jgi:formylmethanofuran dehydrogenase subunit E
MIDQETIDKVVEFHGHMCAGLALGIRAAEVGLAEIGAHAADEEVVAVVETDMCAVDAIQFLTGCTFGKGNLVHLDHGKNAYTFVRRSDGKAVRISTRPGAWSTRDPEWLSLFARVRTGTATPAERDAFAASQRERSERVLDVPLEELYDVREVDVPAPRPARILASVACEACGEATMETRVRRLDGRELCLPCFEDALAGTVRLPPPRP